MLFSLVAALLAQATAPVPAAPPAAESTFAGSVGLGGVRLTGNSESTAFSFNSSLGWKTPHWIYGFKASAAYARSTDPSTGVESTSALNGSAAVRGARRVSETVSIYLEGNVDADHLKSIEWRPAAEVGASLQLVDEKEGDFQTRALRLDFGMRGGREYRFQYYPTPVNLDDVTIAAPRAGFAFRYTLSRDAVLTDELIALVNLPDGGPRLLLTNVIKLATQIQRRLAFAVSYSIAEDSDPPPLKKNLDTMLTLALELTL
jgi:putative salt-induced outer membrane protein YdiY